MRIVLLAAVALAACAAPAQAFKLTHRITVTGQLADHWTIDEPGSCTPFGGGTTTLDFSTRTPLRARPMISSTYAGKVSSARGSWALLVVGRDGHIVDLPDRVGRATLTRDDRTQLHPSEFDEPCDPPDRTGCGVQRLKHPLLTVNGYDRRHIYVDLENPVWDDLPCLRGGMDLFSDPPSLAGGTTDGTLRVKVPQPSKLRRRKVVTVTGSSHKRMTFCDAKQGTTSDDVTRTATVTFTLLR